MNTRLIVYRLITFTILPIAAILGFGCLVMLFSAFTNPAVLLYAFIIGSLVLYTYASFIFFSQGVMNGKKFKASLKDWVKVNAYVTLLYSAITITIALLFFTIPAFQKLFIQWLISLQGNTQASITAAANREALTHALGNGLLMSAVFSVVLIVHIIITMGLLKQFNHLFGNSSKQA